MRILVSGGGTAGHVSPIIPVIEEIKKLEPKAEIIYIGQFGDKFAAPMEKDKKVNRVRYIFAGKLRRYHGVPVWKQLLDIPTVLKNIFDFLKLCVGFLQALWIMLKYRPDVVFLKGGFVCLPVGLAAGAFHRKIITHDSDAIPGMTNKMIAPWATIHATALPPNVYKNYPSHKVKFVGLPVSADFKPLTKSVADKFKRSLKLDPKRKTILVTGGSLGAKNINDAVAEISNELVKLADVIHITGSYTYDETLKKISERVGEERDKTTYFTTPYVSENMYKYTGVADLIIARGGGSSTAELAAQGKALIMIPNPMLSEGHQLKNAVILEKEKAVKVVGETDIKTDPQILLTEVKKLIGDKKKLQGLAQKLHSFAKPNAAKDLAKLIVNIGRGEQE